MSLTKDELKILRDLYGAAMDLHTQLQLRTSVAETERFWPPIEAANALLRSSVEPDSRPPTKETVWPDIVGAIRGLYGMGDLKGHDGCKEIALRAANEIERLRAPKDASPCDCNVQHEWWCKSLNRNA